MADLSHLYQSVILDHYRSPRNFYRMADADRSAEGYNPTCGDRFTVWLKMNGDVVEEVSFDGNGCAVSQASASLMTAAVKGKSRAEIEKVFERFHRLVTGQLEGDQETQALGKLAVFSGVSEFPMRVKCASLSWHALKKALE